MIQLTPFLTEYLIKEFKFSANEWNQFDTHDLACITQLNIPKNNIDIEFQGCHFPHLKYLKIKGENYQFIDLASNLEWNI